MEKEVVGHLVDAINGDSHNIYRRVPVIWWDFSGMFVTPEGQDVVSLTTWSDTDIYGYVQTTLGDLIGQEINEHPIVGRKLRFIPD